MLDKRGQVNVISCNSMFRARHYTQRQRRNKCTNTFRNPLRGKPRNAPLSTHTHTHTICASQCDHMVWRGLPTHRRGSVRLQCTVQLSAITSCLPALNGHAKAARLSPVTALKLNQVERRHSSPYHAISISMRSGRVHATANNEALAA